jgi:hypothetical protein
MRLDPMLPRGEQMATLPPRVRWKADNYNHLMEQPTIFYPLVLALALLGDTSGTSRLRWPGPTSPCAWPTACGRRWQP